MKKIRSIAFGRAFQLAYYFSYNKLVMVALVIALYISNTSLDIKKVSAQVLWRIDNGDCVVSIEGVRKHNGSNRSVLGCWLDCSVVNTLW